MHSPDISTVFPLLDQQICAADLGDFAPLRVLTSNVTVDRRHAIRVVNNPAPTVFALAAIAV